MKQRAISQRPTSGHSILRRSVLMVTLFILLVSASIPRQAMAADESSSTVPSAAESAERVKFFETDVRPLLVAKCIECHGPKKQHGGLRLDSRVAMLKGGDSGAAIVPAHVDEGLLLEAVRRESLEMPPDKPLTAEEVAIFTQWVADGAVWPASAHAGKDNGPKFSEHWSFQPITNPAIPEVQNSSWPKNGIDHFILSRLEGAGLAPSQAASKSTLYRRMKWDLVGLPATYAEVNAFENNSADNATADVIDQLLASPHYGERWGRYWLDLARFADTKGYVFFEKPEFHGAYTYRDYVIESFNNDLPYDQFIREQLAADKLTANQTDRSLAALGFITVGPRFKNDVHDILADRIDVVTQGFLGLTVACARCHDHKYDPVSTEDYYSLYGVFNNTVEPLHWPFREGEELPEKYREQAAKIKQAAQDLEDHYQEKYKRVVEQARTRLAEYLAAAQARRKGPDTTLFDVIVDGDDLSPQLLLIWQQYLVESERNENPVFLPWNELAPLKEDEFPARAPKVLKNLAANAKEKPVNKRVFHRLVDQRPATFAEVVAVYSTLFEEVEAAWQVAQKEGQTQLADDDLEALRLVLYGPRSPLQTPYHGYKLLRLFPDRESQAKVQELNAALDAARASAPVELAQMLVVEDAPSMIEPRVLRRGNPSSPGQYVTRQYLQFFDNVWDKPFEQGSGRLDLAQAIASRKNPLTARVIVNRIWQHHFGTGIVNTPSDFGLQSEAPSHPQLLDHLAIWFMEHGWSIKKLHRYIMQSATYQQQSVSRSECEAIDPANRLCWKMNRRRFDLETMRDAILFVTGELDLTVGGPSVRGIMSDANHRRTLYTHIDRQNLPGVMRVFDFPPPDVSSASRNSTTVPGQALFLMNHPLILSAAQQLGETAAAAANEEEGIRLLFEKILHRQPTADGIVETVTFLKSDEQLLPPVKSVQPSHWAYGYARLTDEGKGLAEFKPLPHWTGEQFQGGEKLPDSKLGWVYLHKSGGHPGNNLDHVAVMRWTAPEAMSVSISGLLEHAVQAGDGVRAHVFANGQPMAGPWVVHNSSAKTDVPTIELEKGQSLDFVVDIYKGLNSDMFEWSPTITRLENKVVAETGANLATDEKPVQSWNYTQQFRAKEPTRISPWQSVAQVLLLSNEFQFVD